MVKRHKAGLPVGMDLGIGPGKDDDGPADLGHYLAEPRTESQPPPQAKRKARQDRGVSENKVVDLPRPSKPEVSRPRPKAPVAQPKKGRPPRIEIGCDTLTKQKIKRIVSSLRDNGPQDDASASEFLQATAHLVERVHHLGQYSRLRPRGHWGAETARDFIETLSDIYFDALGERYVEERWDEIRARVERELAQEREVAE